MQKSVRTLTLIAIQTAIALIIFIIEAQIPLPIPIPGVKLGLANAVTLFALFYTWNQGARKSQGDGSSGSENQKQNTCPPAFSAFAILMCRILLGAIFTGRPLVIVYSLVGGLLGFAAQVVMRRFVTEKQIWVCGVFGAVFHNIGQILAAMIITGTPTIAAYLPILTIAGIITGVITGLIAQFTIERLNKTSGEIV